MSQPLNFVRRACLHLRHSLFNPSSPQGDLEEQKPLLSRSESSEDMLPTDDHEYSVSKVLPSGCMLCQLPLNVLLKIGANLHLMDLFTMQNLCSAFSIARSQTRYSTSEHLSRMQRRYILEDIQEDRFRAMLDRERAETTASREHLAAPWEPAFWNTPSGKEKCCATCKSRHGSECFSSVQLRRDGRYRYCRGGEGRLDLCEHWNISFGGLDLLRLKLGSMSPSESRRAYYRGSDEYEIVCDQCSLSTPNGVVDMVTRLTIRPTSWLHARLVRYFKVMEVEHSKVGDLESSTPNHPSLVVLRKRLRASRYQLCPHTRSCDRIVLDAALLLGSCGGQGTAFEGRCQHPNCAMVFDLHREELAGPGAQFVYLRTRRIIPGGTRATDPHWLAALRQTRKPSDFWRELRVPCDYKDQILSTRSRRSDGGLVVLSKSNRS